MITSLALVACIQAVSLVPISWDDSEAKAKTANNSNQATAYGNEAEHLQAKAHKTVAATFSLSEHCNIYIERKKNPVKKNKQSCSRTATYMLHTFSKSYCRMSSFMCLCENKQNGQKSA